MYSRLKFFFISLTITAILVFSAFGTTAPAYADDGTGGSTDTGTPVATDVPVTTEVTVTPDAPDGLPQATDSTTPDVATATPVPATPDGATATDVAATSDPAVTPDGTMATDVAATSDPAVTPASDATATDAPQAAASATDSNQTPILEQLPDNTTVTVLDANGTPQPMATQASADAIQSAYDPVWCPEGQSPTPGQNGCTDSFNSFNELLTFLKNNENDAAYQQAGTIYIQQGQYLGGESSVDFNNYNFNKINNYNLTLQGGWNTSDNSTTDTTQFNVPITIGSSSNPWIGSLTINSLLISNVSNQTGLTLYTQGDITVNNVQVTTSLNGTDLNSGGNVTVSNSKFNKNKNKGANINATGNVDISNSTFNENGSYSGNTGKGLQIDAANKVSLASVEANNNQVFGANVNATGAVTVTDSFFSGNKSYSYTCKNKVAAGGYGIQVITKDAVSLDGVTASNNYFFGGHLEGSSVDVFNSTFDSNGSGSISNPVGRGLEVNSGTTVTLFNVEANKNQLFGANISATGDVVVNNSFFDGNQSYATTCKGKTYYGYGIQVVTTGGVFVSQIEAKNNNLFGAHLEGADVSIFGSTFDNNGLASNTLTGRGLEVLSTSNVSLTNVEANDNELFGANIQAVGNVSVSNSFFNGQTVYSYSCKGKTVVGGGYGLKIVTDGSIALNTVEASDNYLYGAQIAGADVSITNAKFDTNGAGLDVESTAGVSLNSVEANENQGFGANIEATGLVSVNDSFFNGNKYYVYNCQGKTYYGYGLKVVTNALISLNNVTADDNNLFGAQLDGGDIAVSLSSFSNNGTGSNANPLGKGLEIKSTGSQVSLFAVTANHNQLFGADIQADGTVAVNNSVFSGNMSYSSSHCKGTTYNGYGLKVVTTDTITLDTVTADDNNLFGASLTGADISISNSTFNNNGSGDPKQPTGRGLEVVSTGQVTLTSVEASYNELFGANIQADGDVTVLSSIFAGNQYYTYTCKGVSTAGYGLKVVSAGNIVLGAADGQTTGVQAYDNGAEGAILVGESSITVSDSSFNNNGADGLNITAHAGNVTLNNVVATGNGGDGVDVTGVCTNVLNVNGGTFSNNHQFGIRTNNITYNPDGAQTFANNSSGNVFQNSTCVTNSGSGNTNGQGPQIPWWLWWLWNRYHHSKSW
jgi:hypothetical protein